MQSDVFSPFSVCSLGLLLYWWHMPVMTASVAGSGVQSHLQLHSEFKSSPGYSETLTQKNKPKVFSLTLQKTAPHSSGSQLASLVSSA